MFISSFLTNILNNIKRRNIKFNGVFYIWDRVPLHSDGYNDQIVFEKVKQATLKVKYGEAIFERDSVLFNEIQYSYPVLAGLLLAALENDNRLTVLDFGGSLGSSYFQCRSFLSVLSSLQWNIVEQKHFVKCGQEYFETDQLRFFYTIKECLQNATPNLALLSSVLQYVPEPYSVLNELIDSNIPYIVIDRTSFADIPEDYITVQHVPPSIYSASYPCWVFARQRFIERLNTSYEVLAEFDSAIDAPVNQGALKFKFSGMILRKL